ncbi:MAG TPA: putative Ig domain-containing protein, partial [Candidatus Sulfotelmatobacter sp.]|nr:putative Ig domain-containing protein [Candidatus Sulfotelmatobacter sp.]
GLVSGNDGSLNSTTGKGVIECLALTPLDGLGTYKIYLDNFQSVPLNFLRFSLDTAPEGATIDPYSGLVQWAVPATTGSFNFTVRVTDHLGLSDTKSFTVTATTAPARESLRYAFIDGQLVLTWTNPAFTLATATEAAGPFTRVSGATSPYTNAITSTTKFFRLIWP